MKTLILGPDYISEEIKHADNIDHIAIDNEYFAEQCNLRSSQSYDFYVYLMNGFDITYNNLEKLIDYINNNPIISAAYADVEIIKDDISFIQYNPSNITNKKIVNVPFIAKQQFIPNFNVNITNFHLWFGMLLLSYKYPVFHIPEPLFTFNVKDIEMKNIEQDMRIINEIFK